jgi:hypothetical protein
MAIEEPLEGAAAEHNAPVKGEEDRFDSSTAHSIITTCPIDVARKRQMLAQ